MSALDTLSSILETSIANVDLKCCFVTADKRPVRFDGVGARPNIASDFVDLYTLSLQDRIVDYAGIGISIQASGISAIDVDHCFLKPFEISSADNRAIDILSRFGDIAYCEYSFSGTGLRVLFKSSIIDDYSDIFFIKNERKQVEYYQPSKSYRYVTVTGKWIFDNKIARIDDTVLHKFLVDYMQKPKAIMQRSTTMVPDFDDERSIAELIVITKRLYYSDMQFQNIWFGIAPGSGKNESELDFALLNFIFEKITKNEEKIRAIFELSPYFKSKDWKHKKKWYAQEYRYFKFVYGAIRKGHI